MASCDANPRHLEIPRPTPETQLVKKEKQVAVTILILFYLTLWEGEHRWGVGGARITQDRWDLGKKQDHSR